MSTQITQPKTQVRVDSFLSLDLECVRARVQDVNPNWTQEQLETAVHDYRYYLALCSRMWGNPLVPSVDVDEVWHSHILFLEKYLDDCQALFGKTLFHVPFFGLQPKDLIVQGAKHLRRMPTLFQEHFGVSLHSYDHLEEEIEKATATLKLTSQSGWSGNINLLRHPELMA